MKTRQYLLPLSDSLLEPGRAYSIQRDVSVRNAVGIIDWIRTALSPLVYLLLPVIITFWRNFKPIVHLFVLISIVLDIMIWIKMGTNRGIGYILITIFSSFLIIFSWRQLDRFAKFRHKNKRLTVFILLLVLFAAFFLSFTSAILGRVGIVADRGYETTTGAKLDSGHLLIRSLPPRLATGITFLTNYWVQGYHGLSYCLDQDFSFTYGFGHAAALRDFLRYIGIDPKQLFQKTYMYRTEVATGYSARGKWHSIYPSLASDLTFVGALIFMLVFGALFSVIAKEAIVDRNPFAVALYSILWIGIIFVPANNQIGNDKRLWFSFIGIFIMWLFSRRYIKHK